MHHLKFIATAGLGLALIGTVHADFANKIGKEVVGYGETRSTLKLTFGAGQDQADALVVNGAVDISATGTKLVLEPNGNVKQRGGTFTILSATDGITGDFAEVVAPKKSWKVKKVMGKVTTVEGEADAVVALTATVPGSGFVVIIQ